MTERDVYGRTFDEDVQTTKHDCPDCGGRVVSRDRETVCDDCGLVVEDAPIDHGPEWRSFEDGESPERRTGGPVTNARHDRGLSTEIGNNVDASGRTFSRRKRRLYSRLRTQHNRARFRTKRERNLAKACTEIARLVSALELSRDVREHASTLFRQAQDENLLVGRSIEAMAAGSVYGACREEGVLRTIEEVADVARCGQGKVLLGYRVLNSELGVASKPISPGDVLPRVLEAVNAAAPLRSRSIELSQLAHHAGIVSGRSPSGVAAGCVYLASEEQGAGLSQTTIAAVLDTTVVTLRSRYYELMEVVDNHSTDGDG